MTQTVLILGASGRFGRNAAQAYRQAGWSVLAFDRHKDDLLHAAQGVDVIVNGWNPSYPDWADQVLPLHARVIEVAERVSATVLVPGNVYVFGPEAGMPWSESTPHLATNPLGRIRVRMEEMYRQSNVRTIILRAGDFLDTQPSGNWFDMVMTKHLAKGWFTYPGDPSVPHAWAFLPDLARAAVQLSERRGQLPRFADVPYQGYTLSGDQMMDLLNGVLTRKARLSGMRWWPLQLARPVWPMARCLLEMRYLWSLPHHLDDGLFHSLLPDFAATDPLQALAQAIPRELLDADIHPNQAVAACL